MPEKKVHLGPSTSLFPIPAVMVSCCSKDGKENNIITLAWVGTLSSNPPIIGICIRESRHSYAMIKESGEFVVNIPSESQVKQLDFCGVATGKKVNKFKECGFTPIKGKIVNAPLIGESPVNIECKVRKIITDYSDSHHLFLGKVVSIAVNESCGSDMDVNKVKPIAYCNGGYWGLSRLLGKFGFSKR